MRRSPVPSQPTPPEPAEARAETDQAEAPGDQPAENTDEN
jgi:hypothetical protein